MNIRLDCYCPTVTVSFLNCYCVDIELLLSWTVTVKILNCYCLIFELLLSRHWTVTVRPLLRFLTISRVIELRCKQDWSRWKTKTWGYKSPEEGEPSSAPKIVIIAHKKNQTYCSTGSVMTPSRLITHNWSSTALNWARPISLVN